MINIYSLHPAALSLVADSAIFYHGFAAQRFLRLKGFTLPLYLFQSETAFNTWIQVSEDQTLFDISSCEHPKPLLLAQCLCVQEILHPCRSMLWQSNSKNKLRGVMQVSVVGGRTVSALSTLGQLVMVRYIGLPKQHCG